MTSTQSAGRGRIATFYSYKGGSGRTMALANVAWILASNGYRVLAVDWDLESPGLHRYFHPFLRDKDLRSTEGVVDLLRAHLARVTDLDGSTSIAEEIRRSADIHEYAVSLGWEFTGGGGIDYVGPGKQDTSYATVVSNFDWEALWGPAQGSELIEALAEDMRSKYDYVLVDSRTGHSDTAGICTVVLPDVVVNCFTLNTQSIEGAAAIAQSIRSQRPEDPPTIIPVPTRVESGEQIKLDRARRYAQGRLGSFLTFLDADQRDEYWGQIEVPYRPFYAYEEVLAVVCDRPRTKDSLLAAYLNLADRLTDRPCSPPTFEEPVRRRLMVQFDLPEPVEPLTVLVSYAPLDRVYAEWLDEQLSRAGHSVVRHFAAEPAPPLDSIHRVVPIFSRYYDASTFAGAEPLWRAGSERSEAGQGPYLVPIRLDDTPLWPSTSELPRVDLHSVKSDHVVDVILRTLDIAGELPTASTSRRIRFPKDQVPLWNVSLVRNRRFAGRHVFLEELRNRLAYGESTNNRIALRGLPGAGKTQIALEYVYRFAPVYDIVWWISAHQPALVRTELANLADGLGLAVGRNAGAKVAALRAYLRDWAADRRWLIVIDNAGEPQELMDLLPSGPGHVLITSRSAAWVSYALDIEVPVFDRADSIALLSSHAGRLSARDADRVAHHLGDLPLAVEQAGAWFAETSMGAAEYLRVVEERTSETLNAQRPAWYEATTTGTVLAALERLRDHSRVAARMAELLAFLAPEQVPFRVLDNNQHLSALLTRIEPGMEDPLERARIVRDVGRFALARIDPGTGGAVMHRLTARIISDSLTAGEQDENRKEVQAILASFNRGDPDLQENWVNYDDLRKHLHFARTLESSEPNVRQMIVDVVRYLRRRADYQGSLELATQAVDAWTAQFGDDDRTTLLMQFHLANALRELGRSAEAFDVDKRAHERLRKTVGKNHVYTLMVAGSEAADLRSLGDYRRARDLDRQTVELMRGELGPDQKRTLIAVNNLGVSLRLTGDFEQATALDRENLDRARRTLKPRDWFTLGFQRNYGADLRLIGDLVGSRDILEEAVRLSSKEFGESHPQTLKAAISYAVTLRRLGEVTQALGVSENAQAQLERQLGHNHPDALSARLAHACALWALGQEKTALTMVRAVYDGFVEALRSRHPYTLAAANTLAILSRLAGDIEEALRLSKQTTAEFKAVLGADHPYVFVAQIALANTLHMQGSAEAGKYDQEIVDRLSGTFSPRHPVVLAARINLISGRRRSQQRTTELNDLLAKCREQLPDDHPLTKAAQNGTRADVDIDPLES